MKEDLIGLESEILELILRLRCVDTEEVRRRLDELVGVRRRVEELLLWYKREYKECLLSRANPGFQLLRPSDLAWKYRRVLLMCPGGELEPEDRTFRAWWGWTVKNREIFVRACKDHEPCRLLGWTFYARDDGWIGTGEKACRSFSETTGLPECWYVGELMFSGFMHKKFDGLLVQEASQACLEV